YDDHEDLYSPGVFSVQIRPGQPQSMTITAWTGEQPGRIADDLAARERRLSTLSGAVLSGLPALAPAPDRAAISHLSASAADFIVRRGESTGISVIAGYPWFADWGRDT